MSGKIGKIERSILVAMKSCEGCPEGPYSENCLERIEDPCIAAIPRELEKNGTLSICDCGMCSVDVVGLQMDGNHGVAFNCAFCGGVGKRVSFGTL